ncbi:MAG: hypothetical protein RMM53_01485 [Bacteroidia bacterium]|nr:hypothetical protein [Bacteroidia bacterium]
MRRWLCAARLSELGSAVLGQELRGRFANVRFVCGKNRRLKRPRRVQTDN